MLLRIIWLSLTTIAMAPGMLRAALCDDSYNLQSVTVTNWEGTDANALSHTGTKNVSPDLSNLQVVDSALRYEVISKFEGACTKTTKPLTLKVKPRYARTFKDSIDNGYMVQMFDSNTTLSGKKFDYWFGFFNPEATLRTYLGRTNSQGPGFVGWYVGVYFTDSTMTKDTSGLWQVRNGVFFDLSGPDDSLALESQVLGATIRKQPAYSKEYRVHYRVQFLKVSYENKPVQIRVMPSHRSFIPSFQARQTGNLVLIQTGEKSAGTEPLGLYNMLGNKVATLHPTGYLYQWNGKTAVSSNASAGVYFVQSGNRILGKFFYSP
jgi:hypothetical protein